MAIVEPSTSEAATDALLFSDQASPRPAAEVKKINTFTPIKSPTPKMYSEGSAFQSVTKPTKPPKPFRTQDFSASLESHQQAVERGYKRALNDSHKSSSSSAQTAARQEPKTTLPLSHKLFKSIAVKVSRDAPTQHKFSPNDWFDDDAAFY